MNFLGIRVSTLDAAGFLTLGTAVYAVCYLGWVVLLFRGKALRCAWWSVALALFPWLLANYPLQRLYGLESGMDRQRNLAWCATAAAGNAPWESGVVGGKNLEPAWAAFVAALSLFDPARVAAIYPFLSAFAIVLVGTSFFRAFASGLRDTEDAFERATLTAVLVVFLVLLAPTAPLDYLSPYRGFWQRMFLLKPNHALGLALMPLFASLLTSSKSRRGLVLASGVLGALGWTFIVHWALSCCGLAFYTAIVAVKRRKEAKLELLRCGAIFLVSLVLVAPYLYYLVRSFPVVSFPTGVYPDDPQRSVWGDSPSRTHSLLFMATLDLGPTFFLALWGLWTSWKRGGRFDLLWLGFTAGAYAAFSASAVLLSIGQARQSDEIYFFLVVVIAIEAAIGLENLIDRLGHTVVTVSSRKYRWTRPRLTAAVALLWLPLTVPWWSNPLRMDPHFRLALDPLPERLTSLGTWIRAHSDGKDVFFAGSEIAIWIPALTGRRVLRTGMPWQGTDALREESRLLFPGSPEEGTETLRRLGVDYVVLDPSLRAEHHLEAAQLDGHPSLDLVLEIHGIKIYRARETG